MERPDSGPVLGVDAGNSKTVALLARSDGTVLAAGRSGCGDISNRAVGEQAALENVAAAVGAALDQAAVAAAELRSSAFSMAGADWPEDFAFLQRELGRHPWGREALIVNDAVGALRAGSPDGTGLAVVCGTYATNAARTADGRTWHASFWHETGGAYGLAEAALRAVFRAELGIDPATALTDAVLAFFGKSRVVEVLHTLTARGATVAESDVALLCPAVLDAAAAGDETARGIVRRQGELLGDYALAAARRVGLEHTTFPLVFSGGVFRHPSTLLADGITARVKRGAPGVRPVRSAAEPAVGALLLALEHTGAAATPQVLEQLAATVPPAGFFRM